MWYNNNNNVIATLWRLSDMRVILPKKSPHALARFLLEAVLRGGFLHFHFFLNPRDPFSTF